MHRDFGPDGAKAARKQLGAILDQTLNPQHKAINAPPEDAPRMYCTGDEGEKPPFVSPMAIATLINLGN
jgi:hypothetical protein